jgi:hypothetical protein
MRLRWHVCALMRRDAGTAERGTRRRRSWPWGWVSSTRRVLHDSKSLKCSSLGRAKAARLHSRAQRGASRTRICHRGGERSNCSSRRHGSSLHIVHINSTCLRDSLQVSLNGGRSSHPLAFVLTGASFSRCSPGQVRSSYERLAEFVDLGRKYDPAR